MQNGSQEGGLQPELEAVQSYIALIDLTCNEEFLELVKTSLLAAIESLPANAKLGLMTFSTKASARATGKPFTKYPWLCQALGTLGP